MVMVLLAILAIALIFAVNSMGIFRSKGQPSESTTFSDISMTAHDLPGAIGRRSEEWDLRLMEEVAEMAEEKDRIPTMVVSYDGDTSRDPLLSAFHVIRQEMMEASQEPVSAKAPEPIDQLRPPRKDESQSARYALRPPPVNVQGIIWGGANSQVIVDGEVYSMGDVMGNGRIVAIDREGVTVVFSGWMFRTTVDEQPGAAEMNGWERVLPSPVESRVSSAQRM